MKKLTALVVMLAMLLMSTAGAFAASDPYITVVNPANDTVITSSSLLISVKITKKQTVKVSAYKEVSTENGAAWQTVLAAQTFTSKNNLSFYTKKIENIAPGKYRIKVETIGSNGTVIYTTYSNVTVKEKAGEKAVFSSNNAGATTFLQSLLNSIFGN